MGIGLGVVLLLLGLVFALGVVDLPASIDDVVATNTLGWILIIVGVARDRAGPGDEQPALALHPGGRGAARRPTA